VGSNPTLSAIHASDDTHEASVSRPLPRARKLPQISLMKAILQATLAAILSGALVGFLLKKKVEGALAPK
jgi:hypothetical protein